MVLQHDPDSLEHVASKVEVLHDHFHDSKQKMTGVEGPNPFGEIKHPDDLPTDQEHPSEHAVNTLHRYRERMHGEFDAAANLMKSSSGALRDAARALRGTEDAAADSLTVKDGSLDL